MAFRKYEDARITTSVVVNQKALAAARAANLNVSRICSDALELAVFPGKIKAKAEQQLIESSEREKAALKERDIHIDYFKAKIKPEVIFNDIALTYWSKKTGLTISELKALKGVDLNGD